MNDKPAAMAGVYVDCKFMPGYKVARISIDIPIEASNEFLRMFGAPDRADPVHVVVARLQAEAAANAGKQGAYAPPTPESPAPAAPVVKAETPKRRSNLAAILCEENEAFQIWLADKYPAIWDLHYITGNMLSPAAATATLKDALSITSRKELDVPGPKADAFDRLHTSFIYHHQVRP